MTWCRLASKKHPELRLIYAIPNGGHRHAAVAKKLKAEGVKAGVPDLHLPVARRGWHGLWIELKAIGKGASKAQKHWLSHLREQGHRAEVCQGWQAAARIIQDYLSEEHE